MAKKAQTPPEVAETEENVSDDLETTATTTSETIDQRLPTMEEPELDILNKIADDCIELRDQRDMIKAKFEDACDAMRHKMRDLDRKRYRRHDFTLVIEDSEKLVIKKATKEPKNPSTRKK